MFVKFCLATAYTRRPGARTVLAWHERMLACGTPSLWPPCICWR